MLDKVQDKLIRNILVNCFGALNQLYQNKFNKPLSEIDDNSQNTLKELAISSPEILDSKLEALSEYFSMQFLKYLSNDKNSIESILALSIDYIYVLFYSYFGYNLENTANASDEKKSLLKILGNSILQYTEVILDVTTNIKIKLDGGNLQDTFLVEKIKRDLQTSSKPASAAAEAIDNDIILPFSFSDLSSVPPSPSDSLTRSSSSSSTSLNSSNSSLKRSLSVRFANFDYATGNNTPTSSAASSTTSTPFNSALKTTSSPDSLSYNSPSLSLASTVAVTKTSENSKPILTITQRIEKLKASSSAEKKPNQTLPPQKDSSHFKDKVNFFNKFIADNSKPPKKTISTHLLKPNKP